MTDAVVMVGQQKGKDNFRLFEQDIDGSIHEQLNKLNARYTCKILVEGVIKRPERNYDQISRINNAPGDVNNRKKAKLLNLLGFPAESFLPASM